MVEGIGFLENDAWFGFGFWLYFADNYAIEERDQPFEVAWHCRYIKFYIQIHLIKIYLPNSLDYFQNDLFWTYPGNKIKKLARTFQSECKQEKKFQRNDFLLIIELLKKILIVRMPKKKVNKIFFEKLYSKKMLIYSG